MTNSRRTHRNRTLTKPIVILPCEPCMDLKYTPDFADSIMTVYNLAASQVPSWFHQRGHSVFPK